jgi:hypothetical protein
VKGEITTQKNKEEASSDAKERSENSALDHDMTQ